MSVVGDKVKIIDGVNYSLRKHFRLHSIDRTGREPSQFATKPREWRLLENKLKSSAERLRVVMEKRDAKVQRKVKFAASYAERARASGVAAPSSSGAKKIEGASSTGGRQKSSRGEDKSR